MALTIAYEGLGVIANADALINDTGGLGTGDWYESGSGTIGTNPDVYLYGSTSIGNQYASKSGWSYFDRVTALNFGSGGAQEGQFIYMWINISSKGAFKTGNSFMIRLGTDINNYRSYLIANKTDSNGWTGGWKLFVVDPTKAGTIADTGTFNTSSVRFIGTWIDTDVSVRADSIFFSQIAVAKGIRITGTSTTGWADAVDYCTNYASRAWGVLQEREGIYYVYGGLWIGSASQSSATSFADSGRIIQFGISEYYSSGGAWVTSYPSTANKIVIEDAASYSTTFTDGVVVGTDSGRAGSQFIGDPNSTVSLDLYGGNNASSVTTLYGTVFKNITGTINFGNDADHKYYNCSFSGCNQVDPVGAASLKNCTFAETSSTSGALLWNGSIDITKTKFIANTTGAAIKMPSAAGSPYTYTDLTFSGNTYDVNNTSGSSIEVQKSGTSDPTTYTGSTTTFTASTTLNIYLVDSDGAAITANCEVTVVKNADSTVLWHEDDITDGLTTYNYTTGGGTVTYITVMNITGYQPKLVNNYAIPSSGTTNFFIQLDSDPYFNNP